MAWTYGGDPENSDRDAVRLLIGDTDSTDEQLSDAEVDYFLTEKTSVPASAIEAVRAIIAKYGRKVDKSVGDLKISYSQRLAWYVALENRLKQKIASKYCTPVAGGISAARKAVVEQDTDRVTPAIERDQFSYPGTGSDSDADENYDA